MAQDDPIFAGWDANDFRRLDARVTRRGPDECWDYYGPRNNGNVPMFAVYLPEGFDKRSRTYSVRALIYALDYGTPTDAPYHQFQAGCGNKECVNPDHTRIIPVERKPGRGFGNKHQGRRKRRTRTSDMPRHCPNGHDTLVVGREPGSGACRACKRERNAAYQSEHRPEPGARAREEEAWIAEAEAYLRSV